MAVIQVIKIHKKKLHYFLQENIIKKMLLNYLLTILIKIEKMILKTIY